MDILSEVVEEKLHGIAKAFIVGKINKLDFSSTKFDEHKLFLATIAGVYGMAEPMEYVIRQLDAIGWEVFVSKYFYTRDRFVYYGSQLDKCIGEWIDQLSTGKHRYFRLVSIRLLADFGCLKAVEQLQRVINNSSDDKKVREFAEDALVRLKKLSSVSSAI